MRQIKLPIIYGLFALTAVFSQETLSGVQRELDRVEREINREKKLHALELKKEAEFEKRKKQKLKALEDQSAKMDLKTAELEKKLTQVKQQKAGIKKRIMRYQKKQENLAAQIARSIDSLKVFFQSDFPYQKEKRLTDLSELAKDIREKIIGPEEGMNRLFTSLQSAISVGYDSEVYSGSYQSSEGKISQGKYFRLGAVIQVFVSLDGRTVAYLVKNDSTYQWVDSGIGLNLRQNIKKAVKIAEGKSAPELVLLPFRIHGNKNQEAGE